MTKTQQQRQFGWMIVSILIILMAVFFLKAQQPKYKTAPAESESETGSELIVPGKLEVSGRSVNYFNGVSGFYASPNTPGIYPGVVMVHEWWGLNDNVRDMAKTLASNGYRVLAVDLYTGRVAQNMHDAQNYVSSLDQTQSILNMRAAKQYLIAEGSTKIAVLGWCFGGGQALKYSLSEKDLSATVVYYGQLSSDPVRLKNITWPVLGIFGDKDNSIPVDTVRTFEAFLNRNKIPNEIYVYPGVGHAFANPTGSNFAPEETKDAWDKTLKFLEKYLK